MLSGVGQRKEQGDPVQGQIVDAKQLQTVLFRICRGTEFKAATLVGTVKGGDKRNIFKGQ